MRPLRLEVSGLTCFREAAVIDFGSLGLVAIEGPTGAGKSSLLDAMMLALYGSVPRMGSRNLSELISHGRSGLAVTFDFEVRGQRWRVARTINRQRPSQAILSELVTEDGVESERKKYSGVIEVQKEVKGLLGIDVTAFQQAVILPQGKFQEFLQSTPGDRRKILSELLGFQVYATMRAAAAEQVVRLNAEVDALGRQLTGDLAAASEAQVAELELQATVARAERESTQAQVEVLRGHWLELERVAAKCLELKVIDQALVVLQGRQDWVDALDDRVKRAREVAAVAPLVQAVTVATGRATALQGRVVALEARVGVVRAALELANDEARDTEIAAEQIVALRQRIAMLDEARGRFEQRDALAGKVEQLVAALATAQKIEVRSGEAVAAALVALETCRVRVAELEAQQLGALDLAELARWEALRETASRLGATRVQADREAAAYEVASKVVIQSERELTDAEVDRKRKEHAELQADEALDAARQALTTAEHDARVALVREHLHAGEACPVCEQVVATVPEVKVADGVAGLREKVATQRNAVDRARAEAERARAKVAEAGARAQQAAQRVAELDVARAQTLSVIADDEAALRAVVGAAEGVIEGAFRAGLAALNARREAKAAYESALEMQRVAATRAGIEHERQVALHAANASKRDELEATLAQTREELAAVEATLAGLGTSDPKKERAANERVIAGLEAKKNAAQTKVAEGRAEVVKVEAELAVVRDGWGDAVAETRAAEVALDATGWDAAAVLAATLSEREMAAAEDDVAAHRAARAAKLSERESIVRALGPARAGPDDVAVAKASWAAAEEAAQAAAAKLVLLVERLRQANDQLTRADGVRAEHATKTRQLMIYRRLADDLAPKNFQEFLLEEVIADLVRGASERLFGLSGGRYRMAADSSAGFLVLDQDHAGDKRSTDTLSGGETFLASLAMALELSEQIRSKAGRIDLDCIFIDEGFGSLDPETLETVTEAVEGLQRPGRLVGIITHVAELAARMPERIIVEKGQGGSTVRIERT